MIKAKIQINYRDKTLEMETFEKEFSDTEYTDRVFESMWENADPESRHTDKNVISSTNDYGVARSTLKRYITELGTTDRFTESGGVTRFIPASQVVCVDYTILENADE